MLSQLYSIEQQSYQNWVCVISVDGDKDCLLKSNDVLAVLADSRFKIVLNNRPRGFVSNFQNGLQELLQETDVDCFVCADQDDEWFSEMLSTQVEALKTKAIGSMVFSDLTIRKVFESGKKEVVSESLWRAERRVVSKVNTPDVLMRNLVSGASGMFDRALANKCLPFPNWVRFHDHYLAVNATRMGGLYPINKPLYFYNQHENNTVGEGSYEGFFNLKGKGRGQIRDKYELLSSWRKDLGLEEFSLLKILDVRLLFQDPVLYRSYLGYFIGKYFA